MPTNNRVPDTFTLTIGDASINLPTDFAGVTVFPANREAFVDTIRALLAMPGAIAPESRAGVAATIRFGNEVTTFMAIHVHASYDMRDIIYPASPFLDAAISEAVAS